MPVDAAGRLRALAATGALDLPRPGGGATTARFDALRSLAATEDLSVARLAEAHTDAVAILAEAASAVPAGALLGVWASNRSSAPLVARPRPGGWHLQGSKGFCSGVTILDAALVTADADDGERLFLVPVRAGGVRADPSVWHSPALAATATGAVELDVEVAADAAIGGPGFYVERPGFWHGAIGVAACWYGGAAGVADTLLRAARHKDVGPHALAHLGAVDAVLSAARATLDRAAAAIDREPQADLEALAWAVRSTVESTASEVLDRVGRALGATPLCQDAAHARRTADLTVYLRQSHAEADLARLGELAAAAEDDRW